MCWPMKVLLAAFVTLRASLRSRVTLQLEVLALRHQLAVYRRCSMRARTKVADRLLWAWLSRAWAGWRDVLVFVQPSTVIAWQRRRFREHWAHLSHGRPGRPAVAKSIKDLIRRMSSANPGWGSPRIVGELAKLGIHVAKSTVGKYMVRPRKPPSPTWRAFLDNHVKDLLSVDFFVVPTVMFRVLFVFVVLVHERRRILHFNITEHPTAQWTAQQLVETFPWGRQRATCSGIATACTELRTRPWSVHTGVLPVRRCHLAREVGSQVRCARLERWFAVAWTRQFGKRRSG